ncbi:unnamed protein product [Closterium sp. NIES-53]
MSPCPSISTTPTEVSRFPPSPLPCPHASSCSHSSSTPTPLRSFPVMCDSHYPSSLGSTSGIVVVDSWGAAAGGAGARGARFEGVGVGGAVSGGAIFGGVGYGGARVGGTGVGGAGSGGAGSGGAGSGAGAAGAVAAAADAVAATLAAVAFTLSLTDYYRIARPIVTRILSSLATNTIAALSSVSAIVAAVTDFASTRRLNQPTRLVAAPPTHPLSAGGESALGCDVLEGRQFELKFLATASPYNFETMGLSVDSNHRLRDGVLKVKQPPGSPPVFTPRYVTKGFSHREGAEFFHTFSSIPKMTILRGYYTS